MLPQFPNRQTGSYSETEAEKFGNSAKSEYNKRTIRGDLRYLVVSRDVRRHQLISISYISNERCHGRGRESESRRPRYFFSTASLPRGVKRMNATDDQKLYLNANCKTRGPFNALITFRCPKLAEGTRKHV
jgi:hypothetical protein